MLKEKSDLRKKSILWWKVNILEKDFSEEEYYSFVKEVRDNLPNKFSKKVFDMQSSWITLAYWPKFNSERKKNDFEKYLQVEDETTEELWELKE